MKSSREPETHSACFKGSHSQTRRLQKAQGLLDLDKRRVPVNAGGSDSNEAMTAADFVSSTEKGASTEDSWTSTPKVVLYSSFRLSKQNHRRKNGITELRLSSGDVRPN